MYMSSAQNLVALSLHRIMRHRRHGTARVLHGVETELKKANRLLQNVEGGVLDAVLLQNCDRLLGRVVPAGRVTGKSAPYVGKTVWKHSPHAVKPASTTGLVPCATENHCLQDCSSEHSLCMLANVVACSCTPMRVMPNGVLQTESYWLQEIACESDVEDISYSHYPW